jgi:hypothetical protein
VEVGGAPAARLEWRPTPLLGTDDPMTVSTRGVDAGRGSIAAWDLSCRCASARGRSAADAEAEARETKARRRSPASHTPLSAIAPRARAPACQQLSCVRRGERATSEAMLASIHPLKKPTEPLSTSAVSPRRPPLSALLVRSEAWIR